MRSCARFGALLLAGSLGLLDPVAAQEVIAFGDSITKGAEPFDEQGLGGYPGRLQTLLREDGQTDATVHNYGQGGERVSQGLTRLDSVLAGEPTADTVILMEGTNDIDRIISGEYSLESVISDFDQMGRKVMTRGLSLINGTIIPRPPWATADTDNRTTFRYVVGVRDIGTSSRPTAEPYAVFTDEGRSVFNNFYYQNHSDPVGHPNAAGFQLLAEIFGDMILGIDKLAPVNSGFNKSGSGSNLNANDFLWAKLHESSSSIRKTATYFSINGREVPTNVSGSGKRATLTYRVKKSDIECAGRIAVRSEDTRRRLPGQWIRSLAPRSELRIEARSTSLQLPGGYQQRRRHRRRGSRQVGQQFRQELELREKSRGRCRSLRVPESARESRVVQPHPPRS